MYTVVFMTQAQKDAKKIHSSGLKEKNPEANKP
jgi:hypothetical protein